MSLTDRINHSERRAEVAPPIVAERRTTPERRVPEWRRRAAEKVAEVGYVAVSDLTRTAA